MSLSALLNSFVIIGTVVINRYCSNKQQHNKRGHLIRASCSPASFVVYGYIGHGVPICLMLLRVGQQMLLLYPALSRTSFKQLLRKIHPHVTGIRPNLVLRRKWNTFENKVSLKDHMRAGASDAEIAQVI